MQILYFLIIIVAAFFVALQTPVNSELARVIGSNTWATIISFAVGLVVLLIYALLTQQPLSVKKLSTVPPYLFIGGLLGAVFVLTIVILFPKVGAMNVVILVLVGQMICSLLIDQYGWFNAPISPINLQKIAALALMLIAVLWFQKSRV